MAAVADWSTASCDITATTRCYFIKTSMSILIEATDRFLHRTPPVPSTKWTWEERQQSTRGYTSLLRAMLRKNRRF